jgi:hypothetical protein
LWQFHYAHCSPYVLLINHEGNIMKIQSLFLVSIISFFCISAFAEDAATGICKDGTSYTGATKKGACRGHKGIKEWFGDKAEAAPAATPDPAASAEGAATGMCKDGTAYTGTSKKGACRGHKGLKEWYADADKPAEKTTSKPAAAPVAAVPADATGLCKDGTAYTGESKRGACRGHKGLKEWYADSKASAPGPAAAAPAAAPAVTSEAATGMCKDGTEYTGASKRGACRGHKGLKDWYADTEEKEEPTKEAAKPAAPAAAKEAPAPASKAAAAPAAGSGQVWVNTRSKIYHCEGAKYYGRTKEGEYMSEADAQAKGFIANRKKVCN